MAQVKVVRLDLTKERLAAIPKEERSILLLLGHATNEINVLHKVMLAMLSDRGQPHEIRIVEHGQALIVFRLLIGALHENWLLFKRRVQANQQCRSAYLANLPSEAAASLKVLNRHFGEKSPLSTIRDKLAFHKADNDDHLDENFHALPNAEPWAFYLGDDLANTFYYASELVMTRTAAELGGGFPEVFSMALRVAKCQLELFGELITLIVHAHFPTLRGRTLHVEGPEIDAVHLPFFVGAGKPDSTIPAPITA